MADDEGIVAEILNGCMDNDGIFIDNGCRERAFMLTECGSSDCNIPDVPVYLSDDCKLPKLPLIFGNGENGAERVCCSDNGC